MGERVMGESVLGRKLLSVKLFGPAARVVFTLPFVVRAAAFVTGRTGVAAAGQLA
jgi:hypothetical protein